MDNLFYKYVITGDCQNTSVGAFSLTYTAYSSSVYVTWTNPISGASFSSGLITTPYVVTGLTGGSYSFTLSTGTPNQDSGFREVNLFITTGCNTNLISIQNSTCGTPNGVVQSITSSNDGANFIYLYSGDTLVNSGVSSTNSLVFNNLFEGIYYSKVFDFGGCESTSNSVIVRGSTPLDFGLYVVNTPSCLAEGGRIYITGLTGTPPFTYSWSGTNRVNEVTESYLTGLTPGNFSSTVTDVYGCSLTKYTNISYSEAPSVQAFTITQPSCFQNDGSITFTINGGSAPFYYYLSNGVSQTLLSNQVTFTGLTSGSYILTVTDVGLCTATQNVTILTSNSFAVVSTSKVNQSCNRSGSISASIQGGNAPYVYVLSSTTMNSRQSTSSKNTSFTGLQSNNYKLTISDSSNSCSYTEDIFVENERHFDFSITASSTTCGSSNGNLNISVNEIITGLTYTYLLSNGQTSSQTTATTYTFSSLSSGIYNVTVTDSLNCSITKPLSIGESSPISVFMYPTGCFDGDRGTITCLIKGDEGPFNLTWSDNANGQTGIYVTGLTAGTYTVTISGESGCLQTASAKVECNPISATSYSFKYNSGVKSYKPATDLTLKNMMYSGFESIVSSGNSCSLVSANFSFKVNLSEVDYIFPFYFSQSFDNVPNLNTFGPFLENAILSIPYIDSCIVDINNATIDIISAVVNGVEYYKDDSISFTVIIDYKIQCVSFKNVSCITPTPVVTSTPTITPTSTIIPTPTLTKTVTVTPSVTKTVTPSNSRFVFSVKSGSTINQACYGTTNLTLYGEESTFDFNSEFYNVNYGPVTIDLSGFYSYNGVYCELDSSGNVIGTFGICVTPTATPTATITRTPTKTPTNTPTNSSTSNASPTVTPTNTLTPTISPTPSIGYFSFVLGSGTTASGACENYFASPVTFYGALSGGSTLNLGDILYQVAGLPPTTIANDNYYSNGNIWYLISGGTGQIVSIDPNGCVGLVTPSPTPTQTTTPTVTPTNTVTNTNTPTVTVTQTETPTNTPTVTPTTTVTPTVTPSS